MKNPWKTNSSKTAYKNPWIEVIHNEVTDPSGNAGIYGKVHFKNIAVGILPIDEHGNTWLVGQFRYTLNQYSWEIPEGGCPIGTDPLEAAKRELKEETGIMANNWSTLFDLHTSNSVTDEYGITYLAKGLTFGDSEPESTEDLAIKKVAFQEAYEMVLKGEITDLISISAIMKYQLMKLEG